MPAIAFMASKGGVGKTALCQNLAVAAQLAGRKAYLVDLDEQQSLSDWFEDRAAAEPEMIDLAPEQLPAVLAALPSDAFAFLDMPARTDERARLVARHADLVVVPVRPAHTDLLALRHTVRLVSELGRRAVVALNFCPSGRGTAEAVDVTDARAALAAYKLEITPVTIGDRVAFRRAPILGQAVLEYEPTGRAADEIKALWSWLCRNLE